MLAALCDSDTSSIDRIVSAGPLRYRMVGVAAGVHSSSSHIANGLRRASPCTEMAVRRFADAIRAAMTGTVHLAVSPLFTDGPVTPCLTAVLGPPSELHIAALQAHLRRCRSCCVIGLCILLTAKCYPKC